MAIRSEDVTVQLGDGVASFRRSGQTRVVIASILGTDRDAQGNIVRVFLDRVVHRPRETKFIGWQVSGAISTVLSRANPIDRTQEK